MRPPRQTPFWGYHLRLEVGVLVLLTLGLFLAGWITLGEMNRKYLELRLADAPKVNLNLEASLGEARQALATLARLPEADRTPSLMGLFPTFADLYLLDPQLRVERIFKAVPASKVFRGFSFAGGRLGDYLRGVYAGDGGAAGPGDPSAGAGASGQSARTAPRLPAAAGSPRLPGVTKAASGKALSYVTRGVEDEGPSLYVALNHQGERYLGRLDLAFIEHFLTQYSNYSGTPVFLVSQDGFVMVSGAPSLNLTAIDVKKWAGPPDPGQTLAAGERDWIPVVSAPSVLGARILTLIPTEVLAGERQALLLFLMVFASALALLVYLKNRHLNELLARPLAALTQRMRDLEVGQHPEDGAGEPITYRLSELAEIQTRFATMARAIRQREASLTAATARAQAASQAKSNFLANMSHEIRTPLNAILGFAQVLARDANLTDDQRRNLETIQRSGDHLLSLINAILDMAQIEAGRMSLHQAPFDLLRLLREMEALFSHAAQRQGLNFRLEAGALPRLVVGDEMKLRQVLINLISNALKFTPAGKVQLRVEPLAVDRPVSPPPPPPPAPAPGREAGQPSPSAGGGTRAGSGEDQGKGEPIRFSVRDTGIGIAPEDLATIFQPFFQAEAGLRQGGGTGLGLALCDQFVRLMGGELQVRSSPGEGSCFFFTLSLRPLGEPEPARPPEGEGVMGLEPPATAQPARVERLSPRAAAGRLAAYPEAWRSRLREAVNLGDFGQIGDLLQEVQGTDPALDEALAQWAYDYDLDALVQALGEP